MLCPYFSGRSQVSSSIRRTSLAAGKLEGQQAEKGYGEQQLTPQQRLVHAGLGGEAGARAVVGIVGQLIHGGVSASDR